MELVPVPDRKNTSHGADGFVPTEDHETITGFPARPRAVEDDARDRLQGLRDAPVGLNISLLKDGLRNGLLRLLLLFGYEVPPPELTPPPYEPP